MHFFVYVFEWNKAIDLHLLNNVSSIVRIMTTFLYHFIRAIPHKWIWNTFIYCLSLFRWQAHCVQKLSLQHKLKIKETYWNKLDSNWNASYFIRITLTKKTDYSMIIMNIKSHRLVSMQHITKPFFERIAKTEQKCRLFFCDTLSLFTKKNIWNKHLLKQLF